MNTTNKTLAAVITITLGILFLALKGSVISIALTVLGAALILSAIFDFVKKSVPSGIVKAVVGVLAIVFGWTLVSAALYIIAALLLILGCLQVYELIKAKGNAWKYVQPILTIAVAICLFFNQGGTISWIFIVSGICLIIEGLLLLVESLSKNR